jgi:transposase
MPRGKELSIEMRDTVIQLKNYFDKEKKAGQFVSTKDSFGRTAAAMEIGVATVKRVISHYKRTGNVLTDKRGLSGRRPDITCESMQVFARDFIRSQNLIGARVSVEKVRTYIKDEYNIEVNKTTLWRALKRWGFTFGVGRRRDSLKEKDYVVHARRAYLREIRANRSPEGLCIRPEVYLDETYINKNHSQRLTWYQEEDGPWVNKPSGVGPRLIIVNAIMITGWVKGAELVFEAKKCSGDYHGQMNWENFSIWFKKQLLPNIPKGSIIILDNARYHNVLAEDRFPKPSSTKDELRDWLTRNKYSWRDDMLKSELYDECVKYAPAPEFKLDKLAKIDGHKILRTPQYHPELQPIETCWAVVKNYMGENCDFTMSGMKRNLPDAFEKVTKSTCEKVIAKVRKREDDYWTNDAIIDEKNSSCSEEEN